MKALLALLVLFGASRIALAEESAPPAKALCAVCAAKGETEPEKVKARGIYEGKTFFFCSEACKAEFDKDPAAYLPPVLPRPAPDVAVFDLDGTAVKLSDYRGKVVLLDFWATWCKPCIEMMPTLQKLHERHSAAGLALLGVSIDEGANRAADVAALMNKKKLSYPVYFDSPEAPAWRQFGVRAIPATFLIDKEGQIVRQWTGSVDAADLADAVALLLSASK